LHCELVATQKHIELIAEDSEKRIDRHARAAVFREADLLVPAAVTFSESATYS
jgi:hypothetical protein